MVFCSVCQLLVAAFPLHCFTFFFTMIPLGGIPGPLTVESEGLSGALHKNEQIIISLLMGGG